MVSMEGVLLILIVLCMIFIAVLLLGKFQKNEPVADMIYFNIAEAIKEGFRREYNH